MKVPSVRKVAIVYDRINKWGGAERVLLTLHEMFPKAPLYTSVYDEKKAGWAKVFPKVYTSFLQSIPFAKSNHELLAPLMPFAFGSFNFDNYDLVISVTSEAAKGIRTKPSTLHICYCLTPTRYLWSHYVEYFENLYFQILTRPIVSLLKVLDKKSAQNPDVMIAISSEVQNRIKKYYGRNSEIVFPPVKISKQSYKNDRNHHYLVVSRLVGYKKVDLVIDTFNKLEDQLIIVGIGREQNKLKSKAESNIKFVGQISDKELATYYQSAKALIMPQEEDFGIVAVEAQSYGVPVIAYKKGGARDTVIDGKTGVLFGHQTVDSLTKAIAKFKQISFNHSYLVKNAKKFSKENFKRQFTAKIAELR